MAESSNVLSYSTKLTICDKVNASDDISELIVGFANQLSGPALNQATIEASPQQSAPPSRPIQQDYYKPKEYDPSTQVNPLIKPGKSLRARSLHTGRRFVS